MSVYREYYEVHDSEMTNYISCVDFWGELLKMSLSVWVHGCNGVHIAMGRFQRLKRSPHLW